MLILKQLKIKGLYDDKPMSIQMKCYKHGELLQYFSCLNVLLLEQSWQSQYLL